MNFEKIFIYLGLLLLCILFIIYELKSIDKKNSDDDEFTNSKKKIRGIDSLFYVIVILIIILYLIYKEI
jgi:Na+/H+ antiporter NhaC